jgi:hypothetical protein
MAYESELGRDRQASEVAALRASLARDESDLAVLPEGLTLHALDRLAAAGGGTLSAILLSVQPSTGRDSEPPPDGANLDEQMVSVALRFLTPIVRRGDLLARAGGRDLIVLLPATGPLEARSVGRRLSTELEGKTFWHADRKLTMHCMAGLSSRGVLGLAADLSAMVEAARRNPLK